MKAVDVATGAVGQGTRGVDDSRLIARTFMARFGWDSINSVAIVTDLALLAVVTCQRNKKTE